MVNNHGREPVFHLAADEVSQIARATLAAKSLLCKPKRRLFVVNQMNSAFLEGNHVFIQHQVGYAPLQIRGALVPVANFGSTIAWPLILLGLFFNSQMSQALLNLGILAFSLAVLFQIVTLPVEFNASRRAIKILGESNLLYPDELSGTKKVLTAAALTYVAGAASAILQLLRILILTGGRRDD